jgi:hypothetical protein
MVPPGGFRGDPVKPPASKRNTAGGRMRASNMIREAARKGRHTRTTDGPAPPKAQPGDEVHVPLSQKCRI